MTATAPSATRANRDGHPCPPWCTSDHARFGYHGSRTAVIDPAGFRVQAVDADAPGMPAVCVTTGPAEQLWIEPDRAEALAVLVEQIATATAKQHRELAAAIRQAAAQITAASGE